MAKPAVKFTANVSSEVYDALQEIASQRGVTMTEALRQAISHEKYFLDASLKNQKILLEDGKTGAMREVVLNPVRYGT